MHRELLNEEIIATFKAGDEKALEAIFSLFYKPLCLFAERIAVDRQAAEDIVSDSFVKLWAKNNDFQNLHNIKAFLYISTRNACLNLLKQTQRESLSKKQLSYLSSEKDEFILNEIIRSEVLREILMQVNQLPHQCQKIFKMSYLEGLKNMEIAEKLNISVHTVKNQKARAIQLLKVKLPDRNLMTLILQYSFLASFLYKN